jgi:hypothetical protein
MGCKSLPFIVSNSLFFTAFRMFVIFHLFSNMFKTVLGSSHIWFCREFQALSFDIKGFSNHTDNRSEILKILRGQLFMGHPLLASKRENISKSSDDISNCRFGSACEIIPGTEPEFFFYPAPETTRRILPEPMLGSGSVSGTWPSCSTLLCNIKWKQMKIILWGAFVTSQT